MKIPIFLTTGLALLAATTFPCHAQTPPSPTPTPPRETTSAAAPAPATPAPAAAPVPAVAPEPAANPVPPPTSGFPLPDGPPLETRVFEIPADFSFIVAPVEDSESPPADPFATSKLNQTRLLREDIKKTLIQLGIDFTVPGSRVSRGPGRSEITMVNEKNQLDNLEMVLLPLGTGKPRQGLVRVEVFSLPPLAARKALIAHSKETELHAWLDSELAKPGSGVKLERHSLTIVRAGQKSQTQSQADISYASNFRPGSMVQTLSLPPPAGVPASPPAGGRIATNTSTASVTAAPDIHPFPTPESFMRRQTGDNFEVELAFRDDHTVVELNLAAETSRRLGIIRLGLHHDIYQPAWQTQRTATQAAGIIGKPMLISTFSPPVNTGVPGGNTEDRTWLLFVTVTEPE